jgi:predicted transcriptional regulator
MSEHLTENIKLRLDGETLEALRQLAASGDRNVAQEMRRALRAYVEAMKKETA